MFVNRWNQLGLSIIGKKIEFFMNTIEEIQSVIEQNFAVMLYFSSPMCGVCHALKPKLFEAIENRFEKFVIVAIDSTLSQEVSAHFGVFTNPTVIVFLDGKEFLRKSRNMSVSQVIEEIARPYEIFIS